MPKPTDGGPAFPVTRTEWTRNHPSGESVNYSGMSLRDWFSAMPLNEVELDLLRTQFEHQHPEKEKYTLAEVRCFHADAMLKARQSEPQDA